MVLFISKLNLNVFEYQARKLCDLCVFFLWPTKIPKQVNAPLVVLIPLISLYRLPKRIHSSVFAIIQKFLTNQIAADEIIIVMAPYCPTPQHLLHLQEGVNLLCLKTFSESKCPGYQNFLLKLLPDALQWCEMIHI